MLPSSTDLFARCPDAVLIVDAHGLLQDANPAACQLLGFSESELRDRPAGSLVIDGHAWTACDRAAFHEAGHWHGEIKLMCKDGKRVPVEAWAESIAGPPGPQTITFLREVTARKQIEDITATIHIEEELRQSEARYRTLVEHLPAVVYVLASDERRTGLYFSPQYMDLTGYAPEEGIQGIAEWLPLVHPDDRERLAAEDARAQQMGEALRIEYRFRRKDGFYIWLRDECAPVRNDAGDIILWQGVIIDITERKHAESALAAERQLLTGILETVPDPVYAKDTASRFIRLNPATTAYLGIGPRGSCCRQDGFCLLSHARR